MSDTNKYARYDLIYVLGQIPNHILFVNVFGLLFLAKENNIFPLSNHAIWLVIGVLAIPLIFDIYNLILILIKISKQKLNFFSHINKNLYLPKSEYKFASLNNTMTAGTGLALFGFLIFPEANFLLNNPAFGQTLTTIMAVFGVICAAISLILSRFIYKDYLKELSISKGN